MWAQKEEKEFWLNWLNHYKSLKCLWDDDAKREAGRAQRSAAYQELAELAKRINANADIAFVRGRINAFRTCYRRELRKVQVAKENGCYYEPQLFYYQTLDFLNDSSDMCDSKNYNEAEEDNEPVVDSIKDVQLQKTVKSPQVMPGDQNAVIKKRLVECLSGSANESGRIPVAKRKLSNTGKTNSFDFDDTDSKLSTNDMVLSTVENENDEYEILGKRIAAHFRNMTLHQRLIAEKIITDVCIYGRMERLTLDSAFYVDTITAPKEDGAQPEVDYENSNNFIYN